MTIARAIARRLATLLFAGLTITLLAACADMQPAKTPGPPLAGTYWKLVDAGGKIPKAMPGEPEAHIRFDRENKRASGYSAVNNFNGSYEASGPTLRIGPVAATRRAGPPDAMEVEAAFFAAFDATRSYRISGQSLELLDAGGNALASFEAKPMP